MAFLSNTERNCDFLHCTNPNLLSTEASLYKHESGPDTYDKTFNDISTRIRSTFHTHIPSFNHTAERLMSKNPLKQLQQQTPGPGSYLPIQTTNFINVAKIDETHPQHFLSRTERFKYLSGSTNTETTPGPGEYNSNDAKRFDKYRNNNKIISKLHYYIDKGITNKLISCAKDKNIPYQLEVTGGTTGTDADVISISKGGIPCGLVSEQTPQEQEKNLITTRIMRLRGLEEGVNSGGNVDTYNRYVYIHGTNQEDKIGTPNSHGCVLLRNNEIVELFDVVNDGTIVLISME